MAAGAGRAAYNGKDARSGSPGEMLILWHDLSAATGEDPRTAVLGLHGSSADHANTNPSCWGTSIWEEVERHNKRLSALAKEFCRKPPSRQVEEAALGTYCRLCSTPT